ELFESFHSPRREHDARARRVEHASESCPESRARAGHDRHLAVEAERFERVELHRTKSTGGLAFAAWRATTSHRFASKFPTRFSTISATGWPARAGPTRSRVA